LAAYDNSDRDRNGSFLIISSSSRWSSREHAAEACPQRIIAKNPTQFEPTSPDLNVEGLWVEAAKDAWRPRRGPVDSTHDKEGPEDQPNDRRTSRGSKQRLELVCPKAAANIPRQTADDQHGHQPQRTLTNQQAEVG